MIRRQPVRPRPQSGAGMIIAGAICLAIGLSVLAYSAHQWRQMRARLAAGSALLEGGMRELEASRRLSLEVDQWSLERCRALGP